MSPCFVFLSLFMPALLELCWRSVTITLLKNHNFNTFWLRRENKLNIFSPWDQIGFARFQRFSYFHPDGGNSMSTAHYFWYVLLASHPLFCKLPVFKFSVSAFISSVPGREFQLLVQRKNFPLWISLHHIQKGVPRKALLELGLRDRLNVQQRRTTICTFPFL